MGQYVARSKRWDRTLLSLTSDLLQLLKDAKPLEPYLKDLAIAAGTILVAALKGGIEFLDKMARGADLTVKAIVILKQTWDDFSKWLKSLLDDLGKKLGDFGNKAHDALSYINPFAHHSPSLVEQVTAGVAQIKSTYANLGNLSVPEPALTSSSQNYNANTYKTNNVTLNNSFHVAGQATADNVAAYMGFQLEHLGIV